MTSTKTARRRRRTATTSTKLRLPNDPVTRYARRVRAGRIVTGRAVRLACERHLRDLARQRTIDFPYYFDPRAAKHIIDFYPTFLTLETGEPFVLTDWQRFSWGSVFGWKRVEDGGRRFQTAYIEAGKGAGKSPALSGIGLYGLDFDDEQAAEIYSAAFDQEQASIILRDAIRMASDSPELSAILDIGKYNIAHMASRSFFRAVSSEHRSKSGPRPSIVLIDELHEHRDGTVVNKMRAGFKSRRQPLLFVITNAGHDRTSICWTYHQHSLAVLEGTITDEQWFGYICQLDPCADCYAQGYRQPKDGCTTCDDWTDPAVWPKANPSLIDNPNLPGAAYLQTQVDLAQAMPSEQALVKRLNFCCWTESHQVWIPPDAWRACQVAHVGENLVAARAAAFDLSEKLDLTACVIGIKTEAPPAESEQTIEISDFEGDQDVRKSFKLNFYVDLIPYFWLPRETLLERVRTERIPYDLWERDGHLRVTPGPVIDYDQIYDEFTTEIGAKYKPARIGYDMHNATQFALQLRDKAKYEVVEIPQGRKLSESFKLFEALVRLKRIRHAGNPVLAWCVGNAEPKRDRYANLWIEKPSQTKRIDGLIAAVMLLNQLMIMPIRKERTKGAFRVWTPEGFTRDAPPAPL